MPVEGLRVGGRRCDHQCSVGCEGSQSRQDVGSFVGRPVVDVVEEEHQVERTVWAQGTEGVDADGVKFATAIHYECREHVSGDRDRLLIWIYSDGGRVARDIEHMAQIDPRATPHVELDGALRLSSRTGSQEPALAPRSATTGQ